MLTTRQKADYLMQVVKLRKLMILKDNPAFTYQHSNRKQAISRVHSLQDKIVEAAVDNQVYGNSDSVNHQKTVEQTISDALENDRKRVYKSDDNRYINTAVKLNTEKYSEILNNRLNIESVKLEAKIEEEIRKSKYNGLSEAEIKKRLTSEFGDTAKLRTANIIRDALHTNEVNIGFIHALENGFQYKVWNNGRGKGKVRAWHRARFISSVSIDEPFDIFGSYHAEMMYPGDLNGGAENVANCRCWLSYTNNRPSNLRSSGSSRSSSSKQTKNTKKDTSNKRSIGSRIKNTFASAIERIQNKVKQTNNSSNKQDNYQKNKKVNLKTKLRNLFKKDKKINSNTIKYNQNKMTPVFISDEILIIGSIEGISISDFVKIYNGLHPLLKQNVNIIELLPKLYRDGGWVGGGVIQGSDKIKIRTIPGYTLDDYIDVLNHEAAHVLDYFAYNYKYSISNSKVWRDVFELDKLYNNKNTKIKNNEFYVTPYAMSKANKHKSNGEFNRIYAEDFAESVKRYLNPNDTSFKDEFPYRYRLLKKILDG